MLELIPRVLRELSFHMIREQATNKLYVCPCCGYASLTEPFADNICSICFWQDDGQDNPYEQESWGGPNHVSLTEARRNFLVFGAAELRNLNYVRVVTSDDIRVKRYILKYEIEEIAHDQVLCDEVK